MPSFNITSRSGRIGSSALTGSASPLLSTPLQNNTNIAPGIYIIDSSTGAFNITLPPGTPGQWEFQTPFGTIDNNNVTLPAGANLTFTDELGNVIQGDFCIDTHQTEVLITNHDGSDNYIVTVLGSTEGSGAASGTVNTIDSDLLVGQLFYDTSDSPHPSKRFAGETYPWADDPILKSKFDANNHDFITDNADGTYTVVSHTDFIRAGVSGIGQHVDDTTAVNGLAGTVLTSGLQGTNRRTGGTANAIRTTQSRAVTFTGDAETAPNHRVAYFGIYGDFQVNVSGGSNVAIVDESASGYVDIGNTRMQWGISTGGGSQRTIVLPAAFTNTNYAVNLTSDSGTGEHPGVSIRIAGVEQKTTTQFDIETSNTNIDFSWIAIGRKQ